MRQAMTSGFGNVSGAAADTYAAVMGRAASSSTNATYMFSVVPTNGTFNTLRIWLGTAPGVDKQWDVSLYVNGSPFLTVTITGTDTIGVSTGSKAVSAGDVVMLHATATGSPSNSTVRCSIYFDGDTAGESILMGSCAGSAISTTVTRYNSVSGGIGSPATEVDTYQVIPTPGTIKKLYVKFDVDPGASPDAYTTTFRKNGGSTSLAVTIVANDTAGNDTASGHDVAVAAGDLVSLMFEPVDTPTVAVRPGWGMVFVSDTNGESLLLGGTIVDLVTSAVRYTELPSQGGSWSSSAGSVISKLNACTLTKWYVDLTGSPMNNDANADKYTFAVALDGTETAITCTIADGGTGNTKGNDTAHTADVTDGQIIGLKVTPASTPTTRDARWGLVCYISPVSTYNESLTLAVTADLSRTGILSAINALILAVVSGQDQAGGMTLEEALTLAIASGQGQAGGISFEEAVSLSISAISVQSASTEMSAGLSLGITADQGSGNVAEMDATIALSLAAAIFQSESIEGAPQTYNELVTIAAKMGMSRSAVGTLQEAITLATSEGVGLTSQAVMVNALILQIVSSMDGAFSVFVITTGNRLQFVFRKRKDHFTQ